MDHESKPATPAKPTPPDADALRKARADLDSALAGLAAQQDQAESRMRKWCRVLLALGIAVAAAAVVAMTLLAIGKHTP